MQNEGKQIENKVIELGQRLGFKVESSSELDYKDKVDCVIHGVKIQVSASGKSKRTKEVLDRRGIKSITVNLNMTDEEIMFWILHVIDYEQ